MKRPATRSIRCRRQPLAACVASLLALSAPAALANDLPVTSCLDDGAPGTLRSVIASASTGDVVDLSALVCADSKITLVTGGSHVSILPADLIIKGPSSGTITIDGSALSAAVTNNSNVLHHTGTGKLTLEHLTVTGGHLSQYSLDAFGGCVYSSGDVKLDNSRITGCYVFSGNSARGGGIYAKGAVFTYSSSVDANEANGTSAAGGGIYANGGKAYSSVISHNFAFGSNQGVKGGGLLAKAAFGAYSSTISFNDAHGFSGGAVSGGGIRANAGLSLHYSFVEYNTLHAPGSGRGGGAAVYGDFKAYYSSISGNSNEGTSGVAGGLLAAGNSTFHSSTISNNTSNVSYAGIAAVTNNPGTTTFVMTNSTVSGNASAASVGGIYTNAVTTKFYNSTIAFNSGVGLSRSPGVYLLGYVPMSVTMHSTLISNNVFDSTENDLTTAGTVTFVGGSSNNLIRATNVGNLPGGTLSGICPQLGPLRSNGGLTKTHALQSGSLAIDVGDNFLSLLLPYDQRGKVSVNGTGDYLRVSGPIGNPVQQADIGSHEVQQNDVIFDVSFEGCPLLI